MSYPEHKISQRSSKISIDDLKQGLRPVANMIKDEGLNGNMLTGIFGYPNEDGNEEINFLLSLPVITEYGEEIGKSIMETQYHTVSFLESCRMLRDCSLDENAREDYHYKSLAAARAIVVKALIICLDLGDIQRFRNEWLER